MDAAAADSSSRILVDLLSIWIVIFSTLRELFVPGRLYSSMSLRSWPYNPRTGIHRLLIIAGQRPDRWMCT